MTVTPPVSYSILATQLSELDPHGSGPIETLVRLESTGITRVWLPHLFGLDPLPLLAAAASRTSRIRFGTAVTPTWPRHPVTLMQEAFAVHAVSDGRLALGVGVSDVPTIQDALGLPWRDPIGHFREYLTVCGQARSGQIDFDGQHFRVHAALTDLPPQPLPIVASGLNPRAIQAAAQLADGLITLLTPPRYLSEVARPQIEAHRSRPDFSVICCVPVAVTRHVEPALSAAREHWGPFWGYTGYGPMLRAAGCANPADVGTIAAIGDEDAVAAQFTRYAAAGVAEIAAVPFPVPEDPGVIDRTLRLIATLAA